MITPYREVVPKEPPTVSYEEVCSKRRIGHPIVNFNEFSCELS